MSAEIETAEVAVFLKVDPSYVRRLVVDKRLTPTRKVGQTWLFKRVDVERFLRDWVRRPGPRSRREKQKARQAK